MPAEEKPPFGLYINNGSEAIFSLSFHCFVGQVKILAGSRTLSSERHVFCLGFVSMMPARLFLWIMPS